MKKIILIAFILSCLWISLATVWWPTIIDNIYYDQDSNSIRYSQTFYDGLWWSQVYQYDISTKQIQQITKLSDLEFQENRLMSDLDKFKEYFDSQWYVALKEFQIDKLPIQISLTLDHFNQVQGEELLERVKVPPYDYTENPDNYMMSWYVSSYRRNNTIKIDTQPFSQIILSQIPISTCRLDPINFRWFWLENLNTIIIIASSAKSNCREWWYLWEEAHIINWIQPDSNYFLDQNSQILDTYNYVPNRELKPTTWWLYIQPQMEWDNMVQGTVEEQEVEKIWLWDRLIEWIKKILGL